MGLGQHVLFAFCLPPPPPLSLSHLSLLSSLSLCSSDSVHTPKLTNLFTFHSIVLVLTLTLYISLGRHLMLLFIFLPAVWTDSGGRQSRGQGAGHDREKEGLTLSLCLITDSAHSPVLRLTAFSLSLTSSLGMAWGPCLPAISHILLQCFQPSPFSCHKCHALLPTTTHTFPFPTTTRAAAAACASLACLPACHLQCGINLRQREKLLESNAHDLSTQPQQTL